MYLRLESVRGPLVSVGVLPHPLLGTAAPVPVEIVVLPPAPPLAEPPAPVLVPPLDEPPVAALVPPSAPASCRDPPEVVLLPVRPPPELVPADDVVPAELVVVRELDWLAVPPDDPAALDRPPRSEAPAELDELTLLADEPPVSFWLEAVEPPVVLRDAELELPAELEALVLDAVPPVSPVVLSPLLQA